jgi:hypothetical protein
MYLIALGSIMYDRPLFYSVYSTSASHSEANGQCANRARVGLILTRLIKCLCVQNLARIECN